MQKRSAQWFQEKPAVYNIFSSGATDDSCSQQSNSTVLQAYAYPNSCSHFPALVATCWTQAQTPEKSSHLTLPQALKLPRPPHVLTKFGARFPRNCTPGWACPECWLCPALHSLLGSAAGYGENKARSALHTCTRNALATSGQQPLDPAAEQGSISSLCLPSSSLDCKPAVQTREILGLREPLPKMNVVWRSHSLQST